MSSTHIRVWDLPTRLFHWLLVASFAGAYLSGDSERWRLLHVGFGYTAAGLIGFRLIWGLTGSRYARFSEFMASPRATLRYLLQSLQGNAPRHLGHNPAGAAMVFALLGLVAAIGLSGWLFYQELAGDWLAELHELLANTALALVALHVAGVIHSSRAHGESLPRAMITGLKRGSPEQGIAHSHAGIAALLAAAIAALWWLELG